MTQSKLRTAFYNKQLTTWTILGILLITLCVSSANFSSAVNKLEAGTQGHSLVDYLNSSGQRLVKLELMDSSNDELIFIMDSTIEELVPPLGESSEYFGNHTEILQGLYDVSADWDLIKETIEEFRIDDNSTPLTSASERLFYHAANLTNLSSDYITELSKSLLHIQLIIIGQMLLAALIIGHQLFSILRELKHNKELSASLSIDSATGLFNRSKCHEILRTVTGGSATRAIIVFDLNDLKKTNDNHGHRVGDELISSFAQLVQEGTKIHTQDVFVGRYGGDEFMVYYNNMSERDILLYLEEVAFLAEAFNEKETRFQISYAVGHAISSPNQQDITLRQLFDVADQEMYRNKVEMKKKQAENKIEE